MSEPKALLQLAILHVTYLTTVQQNYNRVFTSFEEFAYSSQLYAIGKVNVVEYLIIPQYISLSLRRIIILLFQ